MREVCVKYEALIRQNYRAFMWRRFFDFSWVKLHGIRCSTGALQFNDALLLWGFWCLLSVSVFYLSLHCAYLDSEVLRKPTILLSHSCNEWNYWMMPQKKMREAHYSSTDIKIPRRIFFSSSSGSCLWVYSILKNYVVEKPFPWMERF